jgi:hypothetical protein
VETKEVATDTEGFDFPGEFCGDTIGSTHEDYDMAVVFGAGGEESHL